MNRAKTFEVQEKNFLGKGRRRSCYRMPGTDKCVKFYNEPAKMPDKLKRIRREITWRRFLKPVNINYLEWRYHQHLQKHAPKDILDAFPADLELVYCPQKGWGTVANVIDNYDGSKPRRVNVELKELSDSELCLKIYKETEKLCNTLVRHGIRFFDHYNILVQWSDTKKFKLRIVDFEPICRSPIPGLANIGFYVRYKCQCRMERYLARLRKILSERYPPITIKHKRVKGVKKYVKRLTTAVGIT